LGKNLYDINKPLQPAEGLQVPYTPERWGVKPTSSFFAVLSRCPENTKALAIVVPGHPTDVVGSKKWKS
jgi:hypothetical protein